MKLVHQLPVFLESENPVYFCKFRGDYIMILTYALDQLFVVIAISDTLKPIEIYQETMEIASFFLISMRHILVSIVINDGIMIF